MTTELTPLEQFTLDLERHHQSERLALTAKHEAERNPLTNTIGSLNEIIHGQEGTMTDLNRVISNQQETIEEQRSTIGRIKPTLFGAFMGGLATGTFITLIIGAYIVWVQHA